MKSTRKAIAGAGLTLAAAVVCFVVVGACGGSDGGGEEGTGPQAAADEPTASVASELRHSRHKHAKCEAGSTETCGKGGVRVCEANGAWGPCTGECLGLSSQQCGNCGMQTRTCETGTGQWSPWSACVGQGVCSPGSSMPCPGMGVETCTATCQWSACVL
jgi:hypothetical protein